MRRYVVAHTSARIGMLPMEPGSPVMERKMLRGIRQRAEQLAAVTPDPTAPN